MGASSLLVGSCCVMLMGACAEVTPAGARTVAGSTGKRVSEAELQEDVQRFAGWFFGRIGQGVDSLLASSPARDRHEALERQLVYDASALDISTGPVPVLNLLDMIVFVSLSHSAFEEYWMPEVFGGAGRPLADALREAEEEIWGLSAKVLDAAQGAELRQIIDAWKRDNPGRTRVEAVRLTEFSARAGEAARDRKARGLLASVNAVTQSADQAVLLGERAVFLAQRAPFLLRLQARVSAQEIVVDGIEQLEALQPALEQAKSIGPMLGDASELTHNAQVAAAETRRLVEALEPVVEKLEPVLSSRESSEGKTTGLEETLGTANELTERALPLVRELRALAETGDHDVERWSHEADRLVRRWLSYLFLVGAAWTVLFWLGYYAFRRATAHHASSEARD